MYADTASAHNDEEGDWYHTWAPVHLLARPNADSDLITTVGARDSVFVTREYPGGWARAWWFTSDETAQHIGWVYRRSIRLRKDRLPATAVDCRTSTFAASTPNAVPLADLVLTVVQNAPANVIRATRTANRGRCVAFEGRYTSTIIANNPTNPEEESLDLAGQYGRIRILVSSRADYDRFVAKVLNNEAIRVKGTFYGFGEADGGPYGVVPVLVGTKLYP